MYLNMKRGIGIWNWHEEYVNTAIKHVEDKLDWYYNWHVNKCGIVANEKAEFVPMIWCGSNVNEKDLKDVTLCESPYVLTFNEPDNLSQANMSVEEAIGYWPRLEQLGKQLGSPAVAYNALEENGWLDRFMKRTDERGFRVDFLCIHRYTSSWPTVETACDDVRSYLIRIYEKYKKPIWLTEFSLIDWTSYSTGNFPPLEIQCEYAQKIQLMLNSYEFDFVHRYAWFSASSYNSGVDENTYLFQNDGTLTSVGEHYFS